MGGLRTCLVAGAICVMVFVRINPAVAQQAAQATGTPPVTNLNIGTVSTTGSATVQPSGTGSLAQAIALKKAAPNVIYVQPQSQIIKLPDVNVAEALQRLPSISIETDSGEGRFINIRGMDADLDGGTFDGTPLPVSNQSSITGGGRAIAYDVFPAGLVGGVEVVDSLTPDMDAEGLGGSVNLLPPALPTNGKPLIEATLGTGYEKLRNTGVYQGTITLGSRFGLPGTDPFANAKPFGILGTFTNYTDRRGVDDVEETYSSNFGPDASGLIPLQNLLLRHYQYHRVRQAAGLEFDFDPNPQTHAYLRMFYSGYDETADKNILEIDGLDGSNGTLTNNGGGSFTATGASAQKDYTYSNEKVETVLVSTGGHTLIGNLAKLDWKAAYTEGSDIQPYNWGATFGGPQNLTINYNIANPAKRSYSVIGGTNLANPSIYTLDTGGGNQLMNTPSRDFDTEYSGGTDVTVPLLVFNDLNAFKMGAAFRLRTYGAKQSEFDYNNAGTPSLASYLGSTDQIYYDNLYNVGPNLDVDRLLNNAGTYTNNVVTSLSGFSHDQENVYAGYLQDTLTFGKFTVLYGARAESTQGSYGANLATTDANGNTIYTPNVNHQNYTNIFPSLQLKYNITKRYQLRAAYSTGIGRPGFNQITASKTVDFSAGAPIPISEGNPNLKPTMGQTVDFAAAYYGPHNTLFSVDVFAKQFKDYIASTILNSTFDSEPALITSYENIGNASVQGVELDARQKFSMLPAPFDGFGVDGNVTLLNSSGHIRQGEVARMLPETSPINFNATVFYDKGPFAIHLASTYVSRTLYNVGSSRSQDVFQSARLQLDMQATYAFARGFRLYFDGKNLLNTPLEFTQSASSYLPIQREFYGQTYLFGVRYKY
ncbi:MAG: TonB-dependent receptor [Acidiphilium sp.]|nr:TonB-dependent receptor [Acidiphilium sp.]MDD4936391.1 TonB-dependent receptor [Acidiphilium sp.]